MRCFRGGWCGIEGLSANFCYLAVREKERIFVKTFFKMNVQDFVSKEVVLTAIKEMPEQIPIEELFDKIIYLYKIEVGLAQSKRGEGISLEEMRKKVQTWRKPK